MNKLTFREWLSLQRHIKKNDLYIYLTYQIIMFPYLYISYLIYKKKANKRFYLINNQFKKEDGFERTEI